VQGADIRISAWLAERDAEASYSRRCLREPSAVLGSCLDEARVHTVGKRIKHAMTCAVGVDGYIGGGSRRTLRFSPEGDSVRCDWIFIGPFYRVACVITGSWKRITETLSEPPPVATISPCPTVTPFSECCCFNALASSSASRAMLCFCATRS